MRRITLIAGIIIALLVLLMTTSVIGQTLPAVTTMKLNAGIVTPLLKETKAFYIRTFQFGVIFENEFYVLMHTPDHQAQYATGSDADSLGKSIG